MNQDHYDFLIVGIHPGYPLKRTLLKFEAVPPTVKRVKQAKMKLYYWYAHKASFMTERRVPYHPRPIEVRQVLKSWKESEVTRDQRFSGASWSRPYLGIDDTDAKSSITDTQTISRDTYSGYIEWDITSIVRNWIAGEPNYGVLLSASNETVLGREIRFYDQKNSSNEKPHLIIYEEDI